MELLQFRIFRYRWRCVRATLVACMFVLMPVFISAQEVSVPSLRLPEQDEASARAKELPLEVRVAKGDAPLSRLYSQIRLGSSALHRLPPLKPSEMEQEEAPSTRLKIGAVRPLSKSLDPATSGKRFSVSEGEVSLIGIASEQAVQVRAHFTEVNLSPGAKIFVYSPTNAEEVYGPFEGRGPANNGEFWTPPVRGDEIIVEYFNPSAAQESEAPSGPPFKISSISHTYKDPLGSSGKDSPSGAAPQADGNCHLPVPPEWSATARSVGQMVYVTGGGEFVPQCTGTLLNTTTGDETPYFLTAHHCLSTQEQAQSLRVYWFYNSPGQKSRFTDSATLLATEFVSDFTLLRLRGALSGGVTLAGWTTIMPPPSTPVTGIHHPIGSNNNYYGDYKRISYGNITVDSCYGVPSCLSVDWRAGIIEGGSSGSGLWVGSPADARLIGTLTYGSTTCEASPRRVYYGRFDTTFRYISSYLTGRPPGFTWTATDIATGSDNKLRMLWTNRDGRASFWVLRADGSLEFGRDYGPFGFWSAKKIAVGSDNKLRVLWTRDDGRISLWAMRPDSSFEFGRDYGPYPGWTAIDIAVGADNKTRVLWRRRDGLVVVWTMRPDGSYEFEHIYGGLSGWTPKALGAGSDNNYRVLWNHVNGTASLWTVRPDGSYEFHNYGSFPGWTAIDIAVGSDNKTRVLWTHVNKSAALWTVSPVNGGVEVDVGYGPFDGWDARAMDARRLASRSSATT